MSYLRRLLPILALLLIVSPCLGQDTGQSLYLKASKMIREGDYAGAKVLLERILEEFSTDEIAIKADEKLVEIMDQANDQQRERAFRGGPGIYVVLKSGESVPLTAYEVTRNNVAAESGDRNDPVVRALSDKMPYPQFVITSIDKLVLYTPTPDLSAFRCEYIEDWFPYDCVRDLGPLTYTQSDEEVYEIDKAVLGQIRARGTALGGITAPPNMGFEAKFVSQATGTWGQNPGPVECIIWPLHLVTNQREWLAGNTFGSPQARIDNAVGLLDQVSDDASIEWFIADRYFEAGDNTAFREWSGKQIEKGTALGQDDVVRNGHNNLKICDAIDEMSSCLASPAAIEFTPELTTRLESYADDYKSNVACYLLSLDMERAGDYKAAEKWAKDAEKKTKKDMPLIWYCGLEVTNTSMEPKQAHDAAKDFFKAHKDEMKKLKKENGQ